MRAAVPPVRLKVAIVRSIPDADGLMLVDLDGSSVPARRVRSVAAPSVGDACLVSVRGQSAYVLGVLGAAPPVPDPEPPQVGGGRPPVRGVTVYRPVFTGSFRGGTSAWYTRNLWQGDPTDQNGQNNVGAAFFGTGLAPSMTGRTAVAAEVCMQRLPGGAPVARRPTLWLVTEKVRNQPPITRTAQMLAPAPFSVGQQRWVPLPTGWAVALATGTAGGVAVYAGNDPALGFAGSSIALRMTWTR